jgi:hypothetical protein
MGKLNSIGCVASLILYTYYAYVFRLQNSVNTIHEKRQDKRVTNKNKINDFPIKGYTFIIKLKSILPSKEILNIYSKCNFNVIKCKQQY